MLRGIVTVCKSSKVDLSLEGKKTFNDFVARNKSLSSTGQVLKMCTYISCMRAN